MSEPNTFLDAVLSLHPWLAASARSELTALVELLNLFPNLSLKEIVGEFKKYQKKRRSSPEGFLDRVTAYLDNEELDGLPPEEPEVLIQDFIKLPATTVKALGKALDLNITSAKKDSEVFSRWLQTGEKPPTPEELLQKEIEPLVQTALTIRNEDINNLSSDRINQIMAIVEQVKTQYKGPGLRLFAELFGYPPLSSKDTIPKIVKMIRQRLAELSIARLKAQQIGQL